MKGNKHRVLLIIIGLAFLIRLGHILFIHFSPLGTRVFIDSEIYDAWAMEIVKNGPIGSRPFYQDPLYPYFLALFYAIFGHNLFIIRFVQILLGTGICILIYHISKNLFQDERAGLIASIISALYQPFIFYDGEVEKTGLAVFLSTLFIWSLIKAYKNRSSWFLNGLTTGLATLTRSNFFILSFMVLSILIIQKRWKGLLLFTAGLVIVLGPVMVRNSLIAGELTFTTTQAGANFYIGNSPYNTTGDYAPPPWIRRHPRFEEEDFKSYAEHRMGRRLKPSAVSLFYFKESFTFIFTHFDKFLKLTGKKILLYFNNYEIPDNQDIGFVAEYSPILRLPLFQFGILFSLATMGFYLTRKKTIDLIIGLSFILFALSTIVFFVFSRYRIPSLSFILPYAGLGLTKFWEKLRTKAWRGMRNSLMVALPVLIFTLIPVKSEIEIKIVRAQCIANLATRYYQEDSVARAIFYFNRALTVAPYHTNSLHDLGVIYYFKKDYARAEDYLSRCLRIEPDHYAANFFLARVYEDQGRLPEALEFYKKAQKVQPGNLEIQFNIATVLQKQGRYIEAIAIYNEMLRIAPDDPRIFHNLSVAYFYLKDYRQARINLDRAKDLGMVPNQAYEQALIKALSQ